MPERGASMQPVVVSHISYTSSGSYLPWVSKRQRLETPVVVGKNVLVVVAVAAVVVAVAAVVVLGFDMCGIVGMLVQTVVVVVVVAVDTVSVVVVVVVAVHSLDNHCCMLNS